MLNKKMFFADLSGIGAINNYWLCHKKYYIEKKSRFSVYKREQYTMEVIVYTEKEKHEIGDRHPEQRGTKFWDGNSCKRMSL